MLRWGRRRRLLALIVVAPLLGFLGVVLAETVPDGRIAAHLASAVDRGELGSADRSISLLGTTADHYAECTAVMVGLGDPSWNLVRRALRSSTSFGCGPAFDELGEFAATGILEPQPSYLRYWHGYALLTRPSLAIFGLSGTRWLALAALGVSVFGFLRAVATRFGPVAAGLTVVPALLTTDMVVGGWSISQALGMATAWAGGWLVLSQVSRDPNWKVAALAAALGGAINAYFDLMVAIPASLALCAVAAGLGVQRPGARVEPRRTALTMIAAVGGWAVGLAGMWASKWVLAALVVDRRFVIDSVRRTISFRTSGEHGDVTGTRLTGFTKNVTYWLDRPLTPLVIITALAVLASLVWLRRHVLPEWQHVAAVGGCVAVILVPFAAWYMVLNNHNQIHVWQTYRSVAVAFGAAAAFLAVSLNRWERT